MDNSNPTIFIVDDEPLLAEMRSDYLKGQQGYTCNHAIQSRKLCDCLVNHNVWCSTLCD